MATFKSNEELSEMKVVDLRIYAHSLGIKNVKSYTKTNLILAIEEIQNKAEENLAKVEADLSSKEETVVESDKAEVEIAAEAAQEDSIEINPIITKEPSFYKFVEKYKGVVDIVTENNSTKIYIRFSSEDYKSAVQEFKDNKKFKTNFYCFDNTLHTITLYPKTLRKKSRTKSNYPTGEQSLQIYNMIIEHPDWTLYKIKFLLNCTYTNVRRVYLKYVKGTAHDRIKNNEND